MTIHQAVERMPETIEESSILQHDVTEVSRAYTVHVADTLAEFDALESEWSALVQKSNVTVFQTFEWQRMWWKHFKENDSSARVHIVTLRHEDRVVAIAPFYMETIRMFGHVRRLQFIGTGITDYLNIVCERSCETACIAAFASYLAANTSLFDVLHLVDMQGRSRTHSVLNNALSQRGFHGGCFLNELCPRMKTLESWEATLESFPTSKRKRLRQLQRKVESTFSSIALDEVTDPGDIPNAMMTLIELHQKRWNDIGYPGAFADPRVNAFHRAMAELAFKRGWLFLAFLTFDGKRVACNYGLKYGKDFFHYLSGNDIGADLQKYSVGRVLHIYTIKELAPRGVEVYDFMRGPEEYKYYFNSEDETNWTILMYPNGHTMVEHKFKMILLRDSWKRRMERERFLWRQVAKRESVFSKAMINHVRERVRTNIGDGLQKLRSPEKTIGMREA